jgi:tetratricopeptide (TPR) repeat protein
MKSRSPVSTFVEGAESALLKKLFLVRAMPTQPNTLIGRRRRDKKKACAGVWSNSEKTEKSFAPGRRMLCGTALVLLFSLSTTAAFAASPAEERIASRLKNIELCNGTDRSSTEPQIKGCTALIDAPRETTLILAIAHNNRGDAYATKRDYDRAIQDYDISIKLNPTFSKPFNNRGVAYQKKGDYDRAIKDFDEAIKLSPDYARAFANRAETHQRRHDYQSAVRDYDNAIRLDPSLEAVWNGRCWSRAIVGELQPALEDCNKALLIQPGDAATLDSRGLTYLKMGQFDSAISDYNAALRIEPKMASAMYGRGLARLKKGDAAGGNADLASAKKLEKTVADEFSRYGVN